MFLGFFVIFVLSLIFIGLFRHYAVSFGFVALPNHRSSHTGSTPAGAGIAFYLAVVMGVMLFPSYCMDEYFLVCIAILLVLVIGMLDDLSEVRPRVKFAVLIFAALLVTLDGFLLDDLGSFFGIEVRLGWLAMPFTIFAIVGLSNALNLIDGLDGLAGLVTLVILGVFWYIGYIHHDLMLLTLSSAFIASLFAFLLFNWHPASVFMGDSGSLLLGFVISILAIRSLVYLPSMSILFMVAVPVLDTLVVMTRRRRMGRSIFSPDRCHMHHVLLRFFSDNVRRTVFFLAVLQAVFSMTGLYLGLRMAGDR